MMILHHKKRFYRKFNDKNILKNGSKGQEKKVDEIIKK